MDVSVVMKDVINQKLATSGNRTRASRVAGENSTTEPTLLGEMGLKFDSYLIFYFNRCVISHLNLPIVFIVLDLSLRIIFVNQSKKLFYQ